MYLHLPEPFSWAPSIVYTGPNLENQVTQNDTPGGCRYKTMAHAGTKTDDVYLGGFQKLGPFVEVLRVKYIVYSGPLSGGPSILGSSRLPIVGIPEPS